MLKPIAFLKEYDSACPAESKKNDPLSIDNLRLMNQIKLQQRKGDF
jgi:hypothetical protein